MSSQVPVPLPSNSNTDSTSNSKIQHAAGHRAKVGNFNLPAAQSISLPSDIKHELQFYPNSSAPNWSSYFTIDIKTTNILMNDITLQFNMGLPTGGATGLAMNPCWQWINRLEIVQGGNVISTLQGSQMFLMAQLLDWEEDRVAINNAASPYNSLALRQTMAGLASPCYYATLKTFFNQDKVPILNDSMAVQLRVYMANLADVATVTGGTLTAFPINSVNAICKVTRLDSLTAQSHLKAMAIQPYHHVFHDNVYFPYSVPSGVTTVTTVLSGITGNVAALYFTVRASTIGTGFYTFSQLASFNIADNTGTNIVGGQNLTASLCANILNKDWCKSSYFAETSFGTTDTKANFYCFAFSGDIVSALSYGQCLTSRKFTGNETLTLVFPSALAAAVQVDVYACVESVLEISPSSVRKILM